MKMKRPATIFVPSVASPAKMEQIRGYGHVKERHLKVAKAKEADLVAAVPVVRGVGDTDAVHREQDRAQDLVVFWRVRLQLPQFA